MHNLTQPALRAYHAGVPIRKDLTVEEVVKRFLEGHIEYALYRRGKKRRQLIAAPNGFR